MSSSSFLSSPRVRRSCTPSASQNIARPSLEFGSSASSFITEAWRPRRKISEASCLQRAVVDPDPGEPKNATRFERARLRLGARSRMSIAKWEMAVCSGCSFSCRDSGRSPNCARNSPGIPAFERIVQSLPVGRFLNMARTRDSGTKSVSSRLGSCGLRALRGRAALRLWDVSEERKSSSASDACCEAASGAGEGRDWDGSEGTWAMISSLGDFRKRANPSPSTCRTDMT